MNRQRSSAIVFLLIIILSGVLIALTWANYRYALENPGGNDFLVHWVGARALIYEGISPYSDEVALRIQRLAYGRPALPGEHELRVAYPLYSVAMFSPYALVGEYNLARAIWMMTLEVALISIAWLSLKVIGWRPRLWMLALLLLFSLTWYHSVRPLINGNAIILITLLVAGAFRAIQTGQDELAGVLFAFSTIKPQVVVILILFVFVWAISVRRWKIILWTFLSIGVFSVGAALLIPDWPLQNLGEVLRYPGYNPPGTPGAVFETWFPAIGTKMGWVLTISLVILLLVEWWLARGKAYRWFLWSGYLTLVASQWIGIQTDPGNFIILFPSLILVFGVWKERWSSKANPLILGSLVILMVGLWGLFIGTVGSGDQPQQHPVMFFPLPAFLLIGLYWVRWWTINPPRLYIDRLNAHQTSGMDGKS